MKRKYIVPILIVLFIGWLIFSMSGNKQGESAILKKYVNKAKEITDESLQIKIKQQNLIDQIKNGGIDKEEARTLCEENKNKQQELVDRFEVLDAPEGIEGPIAIIKDSMIERVIAIEKTLKYLETGEEKLANEVKEHLIRSQGGILSAFRRIEDYEYIFKKK